MIGGGNSISKKARRPSKKTKLLFSASEKHPLLSFFPQKNRIKYEQITPGIYVFIQDKDTQQVFLWNSNSGHGHPFIANRVNQAFGRAIDDFSWIGAAGELVYGYEILGLSYCTGFFHNSLDVTEPRPITPDYATELALYSQKIQQKLENSFLPLDRYYAVSDWEKIVFNKQNRAFFFTETGFFQTTRTEQLKQFRQKLQQKNQDVAYSTKILTLFNRLLDTIEQLIKENRRTNTAFFTPLANNGVTYPTQAVLPTSLVLQEAEAVPKGKNQFGFFGGQKALSLEQEAEEEETENYSLRNSPFEK